MGSLVVNANELHLIANRQQTVADGLRGQATTIGSLHLTAEMFGASEAAWQAFRQGVPDVVAALTDAYTQADGSVPNIRTTADAHTELSDDGRKSFSALIPRA
jgi:hypothetical protein